MELSVKTEGEICILRVNGSRIDAAAALGFKEAARGSVDRTCERVLLDLSEVDFVDSSGLGAIVALLKLLSPDQRLDLVGLTPAVAKVFSLTRMDQVFRIFPSVDAWKGEARV